MVLSTGSDSPVRSDSSISSPSALTTTPSAGTWSPVRNTTSSSRDDLLDRDLALGAVTDDGRARCVEHGEPIERALRAVLLHDADQRVRDQHDTEQCVLDRADEQDDDEHRAEDGVEPRENVGPRDLAKGSARPLVGRVHLTAPDAIGNLRVGQPVRAGRSSEWHRPGRGRHFGRRAHPVNRNRRERYGRQARGVTIGDGLELVGDRTLRLVPRTDVDA